MKVQQLLVEKNVKLLPIYTMAQTLHTFLKTLDSSSGFRRRAGGGGGRTTNFRNPTPGRPQGSPIYYFEKKSFG